MVPWPHMTGPWLYGGIGTVPPSRCSAATPASRASIVGSHLCTVAADTQSQIEHAVDRYLAGR